MRNWDEGANRPKAWCWAWDELRIGFKVFGFCLGLVFRGLWSKVIWDFKVLGLK